MEFENHRADVPVEDQQAAHDQREKERDALRQEHLARISAAAPAPVEKVASEPKPAARKPRARAKKPAKAAAK